MPQKKMMKIQFRPNGRGKKCFDNERGGNKGQ